MTKSKTDKHLTLSYKKTMTSKSDLHPLKGVGNPLKGVGNGKIDVFKELTKSKTHLIRLHPLKDLLSFAAKEKNKPRKKIQQKVKITEKSTKSKTDKHLTLSYKKTISKSDLHPLKGLGNRKIKRIGVGNGKITLSYVFKELTPHSRTF